MRFTPSPFEFAARRFEIKGAKRYLRDPVGFAEDCIVWPAGQGLTNYQREILQKLNDERRVAVRGPHGLGKTTTNAIGALWFATTREACEIDWKVITTAGAWRQLEFFLWPEIHKWAGRLRWDVLNRDPFDQVSELQVLNLKGASGAASAVATSRKELIEGAHADHILYIFDESKAIANDIFDAAEGAFSGDGAQAGVEAYALAQSTPGPSQGRFYDIHKKKPGLEDWAVRHVTVEEAIKAKRISRAWVDQRLRQWGEESALFANRVLGEFHSSSEDSVIPLWWYELAVERWHEWVERGRPEPAGLKVNGVDVARGGRDLTVIAERQGYVVLRLHELVIADTVKVADATQALAPHQTDLHVVDVIGVGAGVVDTLRNRKQNVIAFNASRKNKMRDRSGELKFYNNRAAMWWTLREALDPAFNPTLCLPEHEQLAAELSTPKYEVRAGGVILVESKDDVRKRLGHSTDFADAVGQSLLTQRIFDEPQDPPEVPAPVPYREGPAVATSSEVISYAETGLDWIRR